ncbi:hypothetical protein DNHGIG_18420 [Collibacillus ludicampi]|uniref:DUF2922 domain-containing protein n=1 Tax=Collibacillus ludicampi TaxID=2771369 RepID=A0AAV4LF23_9BACL|nr:DUF2922 domain-containing protein [Collibacillus ludicampi]GIM46293.1 hypothetical protein DNHGIG_18420 [Collibacillus ludicampi]
MTSKNLELLFITSGNKTVRFSLANPVDPIDPSLVQSTMDLIVQKNIFATPTGDLVKKAEARVVETNRTQVL